MNNMIIAIFLGLDSKKCFTAGISILGATKRCTARDQVEIIARDINLMHHSEESILPNNFKGKF